MITPNWNTLGGAADAMTIAAAGSVLADDYWVLAYETANEGSGGAEVDGNAMTLIGTASAGGAGTGTKLWLYGYRCLGTETGVSVPDQLDHVVGALMSFAGVKKDGTPYAGFNGSSAASSSAISIPGLTTTKPNSRVLAAVACGLDTASNPIGTPVNSDLTDLLTAGSVTTNIGNGGQLKVFSGLRAAVGTVGATTSTVSTATIQALASFELLAELRRGRANRVRFLG